MRKDLKNKTDFFIGKIFLGEEKTDAEAIFLEEWFTLTLE